MTVTARALRAAGVNPRHALKSQLSAEKGGGALGLARPPSATLLRVAARFRALRALTLATPRER